MAQAVRCWLFNTLALFHSLRWNNFTPSFIGFPLLIIIPPLLHTRLSLASPDHAAHYHFFSL
jgi:hypothetical protein